MAVITLDNEAQNTDMTEALQTATTQRALPDLAGLNNTFGFDVFLASPPPTITSDPTAVRKHLRGYAVQLERHERFTTIWKHQYENQLVNLKRLITALDTRTKELEWLADRSDIPKHDLDRTLLGLPEFEDIYYFLACKTRILYADLQLRFVSDFMTMDYVLHPRASSSYGYADCTVRDMRNFLRAVWFHLLHPVIISTIEEAINRRKYQALKANPLLPSCNTEDLSAKELEKMEVFRLGLNLDASTMCSMFGHLDDVSAMPIPDLLLKVSEGGLGLRFASVDQPLSYHSSTGAIAASTNNLHAGIHKEEEGTRRHIRWSERGSECLPNKVQHKRSKSDDPRTRRGGAIRYPARKSSLLPDEAGQEVHRRNLDRSMVHIATEWLPKITTGDQHDTTVSGDLVYDKHSYRMAEPTRTTLCSLPSTPSKYRMPFHGEEEFPHEPPTPPPKTLSHPPRISEIKEEGYAGALQRETSLLQDALLQVRTLQQENSQLQERLIQASQPKGLFRRLSKARRRSPTKIRRRSTKAGVLD